MSVDASCRVVQSLLQVDRGIRLRNELDSFALQAWTTVAAGDYDGKRRVLLTHLRGEFLAAEPNANDL